MGMRAIAWWPMLVLMTAATFTDLRTRRIPNWLVFPFLAAGVGISAWLHGWHGLGQSLAGAGLGALAFGVLFVMGGMGMGDVKLCAAAGAWVGAQQLALSMVVTGLVGGLMALCWALYGGFLGDLLKGTGDLVWGWRRAAAPDAGLALSNPRARKMPYAPAIAIGTLVSFFAFR